MLNVNTVAAVAVLLATAAFGVSGPAAQAKSPEPEARDQAMDSYLSAFYKVNKGLGSFRMTTAGGRQTNFWQYAEQIETVEDAAERNPKYKPQVTELCNGFIRTYGRDWSDNIYNDDLLWACMAFTRAYNLTGNRVFLKYAKNNFDIVWARAYDTELIPGLWWTTEKGGKNGCVNGPGVIAAMLLYNAGQGDKYKEYATNLFDNYEKNPIMCDLTKNAVKDSISTKHKINAWVSTYNQGTFVGGATMLGRFDDAKLALQTAKDDLCGKHAPGILNEEYGGGPGTDLPGFKGILCRWAGYYAAKTGDTSFNDWLQTNADAAWKYRNSQGVTWSKFWAPAPEPAERALFSWECSPAATLLQVTP
jgi:predicted alpha-1,6-mannanase (GH76 family)